ncbi:WXG100 family type VII secretion target [Streptomyces kaempferi]|uniref:WXG100 family type VII secretion target n=1 Tax=Streptomyces kaempferi TaxID=333725 RepID=A0ABW3XNY0_9ACTN
MSWDEFLVALGDLRGATGVVQHESEHISDLANQIQTHLNAAHSAWQSPAADTFKSISEWFTDASHELESLLEDMVRRMQAAYDNYAAAEAANTRNVGG